MPNRSTKEEREAAAKKPPPKKPPEKEGPEKKKRGRFDRGKQLEDALEEIGA